MKNLTFFNLLLICLLWSCNFKSGSDQQSIYYNNEALRIYSHNLFNEDSLNKALILIDSAIFIKKDMNFFYNKYAIARRLHKYKLGIITCDSILAWNNFDFRANLYKGFLYEDLAMIDSE